MLHDAESDLVLHCLLISFKKDARLNCDVVPFPLVSWVRYGALLYPFLIFDLFLTLNGLNVLYNLHLYYTISTGNNIKHIF